MMRGAFQITSLLMVAIAIPTVGCQQRVKETSEPNSVRVGVSFPALYCFAANVVGDVAQVKSLKTSQGAHGSEVTAADREAVENIDLLFINGLGLDDTYASKLTKGSNTTSVKVVDLGSKLPHNLLLESDGEACLHEEKDGKHEGHDHGDHDPHTWLGPDVAVRYVEAIRRELVEKYPSHGKTFDANAAAYTAKLKGLKEEGKTRLAGSKKSERRLVTVHGAMNYFASAFDVTIAGIVQTTPGKEPSKMELDKLIDVCVREKIRVIAAEPQFSTHGAVKVLVESLQQKGLKDPIVIELDPMETATPDELKLDWYETKLRGNIDAIAKAFAK